MNPNCCGPIANSRMNCGPSGIMIMKSTTCVNCTAASVSSSGSSRGAAGAAREGSAAARRAAKGAGKGSGRSGGVSARNRAAPRRTGNDNGYVID